MNSQTFTFLKAVLGNDGAKAMQRAVNKDPRLEYYLVPRTLLGWTMTKNEFEGSLPGVPNVYVAFTKSEKGYSGQLGFDNHPVTSFKAEDEFALVANLAQTLGFPTGVFEGTDRMLVNLGKSVDALLKARLATQQLLKTGKTATEQPGQTDEPERATGPLEPAGFTAVQPPMKRPSLPKRGGMLKVGLKMDKKDLTKKCKSCGGSLFKSEKFVGCMCWRDLAKNSVTTVSGNQVEIQFGRGTDSAILRTLFQELKNG